VDELVAEAAALRPPWVVKLLSAEVLHKAAIGGVRLDLRTADDVRHAGYAIAEVMADHGVSDGAFLIQEQHEAGVEIMLGARYDATFGPVLLLAAGGTSVERAGDVCLAFAPVDRERAAAMVRELRIADELTHPHRPADVDALVDVITSVSKMVVDLNESMTQMDINPVIVNRAGHGVVAVDALIEAVPGIVVADSDAWRRTDDPHLRNGSRDRMG
jgi:acetyl-CoA synthetase (ADP-forming)